MNNILRKYLLASVAVVGVFTVKVDAARTECIPNDCKALGYTQSATDCKDKTYVKCPYNTSMVFCPAEETCPSPYQPNPCADDEEEDHYQLTGGKDCYRCLKCPDGPTEGQRIGSPSRQASCNTWCGKKKKKCISYHCGSLTRWGSLNTCNQTDEGYLPVGNKCVKINISPAGNICADGYTISGDFYNAESNCVRDNMSTDNPTNVLNCLKKVSPSNAGSSRPSINETCLEEWWDDETATQETFDKCVKDKLK